MKSIFPYFILVLIFEVVFHRISSAQKQVPSEPCIENMSNEERDNLKDPGEGKLIFNTSTGCLNYFHLNKWRLFCENENPESPEIHFDQNTGMLKYNLNGQWYTFSLVKDNGTGQEVPAEVIYQTTNPTGGTESTSDIPADCRTKPTRPYAGRDLVSFDVIQLEANIPSHGVGFWRVIQGDGGKFVDSTAPNTMFTGVQGITYHLRWTIATKCDTLFDESMVRIRPPCDPEPSESFAGDDQFNVESTRLNANTPRSGKGNWSIMSGLGGYISDPGNPKTEFKGMAGETYVLRWIIRNECGYTQDDIIVSMKPPCRPLPSTANAGEDQIEVDDCKLKAELPEHGKGKWKIISGPEGRFFNKDTNQTSFYGKPGETYELEWTVSTACGSSSDQIVVKFSSYCPTEFTDFRDGKKYKSQRIGKQCWMAENLDYRSEEISYYCYDGYPDYCDQYGALYPWSVAMKDETKENTRGVCPEGWHMPSDKDWSLLVDSSGFNGIELQISGKSGFNIPMGGARYTNGKFLNKREYAYYWSSTMKDEKTAWNRYFPLKSLSVDHFPTDKNHSFSVRCIKDDK